MHWLWDNKEWLFSGIGVALLGWIFTKLSRQPADSSVAVSATRGSSIVGSPVANGSHISQTVHITMQGTDQDSQQAGPRYAEKPTPQEIAAQLRSIPAFQRLEARKSYIGLDVRWSITLSRLYDLPEGHGRIFNNDHTHTLIGSSLNDGPEITASLNIEHYPRLKITHTGALLKVSGTISFISDDSSKMALKDISIDFPDESPKVLPESPKLNTSSDYRIGADGTSIMILSERATTRGSGPRPKRGWTIAFKSRYESTQFVDAGESEGFTFEGKEFL
jgi:hypothetical protein